MDEFGLAEAQMPVAELTDLGERLLGVRPWGGGGWGG